MVTSIFNPKCEEMMTCGIYAIINVINGKQYVGKSINIERRWKLHLSQLRANERCKDCNRYLYNSFRKYGESNFKFIYLEAFDEINEELLKERELFWMEELNTLDRKFGYNLRKDTSTKCIVHKDTKMLISELNTGEKNPNFGNKWNDEQKLRASKIAIDLHSSGRYSSEETKKKYSAASKKFWRENPEKKKSMKQKVSEKKTTYKIAQFSREGVLIKVWESMYYILLENPDYYRIAIYNCVNGHKKTYRNYIWKKII